MNVFKVKKVIIFDTDQFTIGHPYKISIARDLESITYDVFAILTRVSETKLEFVTTVSGQDLSMCDMIHYGITGGRIGNDIQTLEVTVDSKLFNHTNLVADIVDLTTKKG
jgi:hypothetical protein